MGKPTTCIGENKGADQLRSNREADQCLCFRYSDSTIHPLLNSKILSFYPASVAVQPGLCQTCSETTLLVFPRGGSFVAALYLEDSMNYYTETLHKSMKRFRSNDRVVINIIVSRVEVITITCRCNIHYSVFFFNSKIENFMGIIMMPKTEIKGTHFNRLGEAVLTSTYNLCFV